jgi:hypothetical protein
VVECLGDIGPGASHAVPVLVAALRDRDEQLRRQAIQALGKIERTAVEKAGVDPATGLFLRDPPGAE